MTAEMFALKSLCTAIQTINPWVVIICLAIISVTSIVFLILFIKNRSVTTIEWGNDFLKLKLERKTGYDKRKAYKEARSGKKCSKWPNTKEISQS
jgi:hypothetical protein